MRRRFLRIGKWVLAAAVMLVALFFLFLCFERLRGAISLTKYKKELARRGEAVTPKDFTRPLPAGSNGVAEVLQGARELVQGEVLPDHYPPRMTMTRSGGAMVGFRQTQWTEDKITYDWERLARDLRTNSTVLRQIRAGLDRPVLDNQIDYAQGPKMALPHLLTAKSLTRWFGPECLLALHENRLPDSLDPLIAEIRLPRFLERDGILISELVRIALGAIARVDTWEALQAAGWTDDQLARIQTAWSEQRFLANFTRSLEGERVFSVTAFDLCRKSNAEASSMIFWMEEMTLPGVDGLDFHEYHGWERAVRALPAGDALADFLKKQVYCRAWRFAWLDQCQRRYLEGVQQLVEISRDAEQSVSGTTAQAESNSVVERMRNKSAYDGLRFPISPMATLSRGVNRAARAETERSLVLTAVALKRYALHNTNAPASLDQLVPQFLTAVPLDYMDGKPIKYHLKPDGSPVLYSVGENGIDDQGDNAPLKSNAGLPTANVWARKDVIWPAPASVEDVEHQ